jgi:mercuric ion transport protein
LAAAPAVGAALLPRLACPCQMPAYAGLLSSMGLAFLMETVYLFPLTAMCLTFSVGGLAISAKRRRGYAPFVVGLLGAILLMAGKFAFALPFAVYGGLMLLLAASLWNSWPLKRPPKLRFHPDGSVSRGEQSVSN